MPTYKVPIPIALGRIHFFLLFTRADITYDGSINLQAIGKRGRSEDDIACLVLFWKITNVLPTNLL